MITHVVSADEWQAELRRLRAKEKQATRARDELAASSSICRDDPLVLIGGQRLQPRFRPHHGPGGDEDSPAGWPQTPPYTWWRRHDEYEEDGK